LSNENLRENVGEGKMYSFAHSVMNNNLSKPTKKEVENNYIYIKVRARY
jgi:hypothetical protein